MSIPVCRRWMQKVGLYLTSLLLWSSGVLAQSEGLMILPEQSTSVAVSDRDINRIHCAGGLADVLWSQEKPVSVTTDANNVFLKFLAKRVGERETRATAPVDLHVFCAGEVYTLILTPHPMDSVTLRLGNPVKQAALAIHEQWGALPLEEKVKRLTLAVYREELPSSFQKQIMDVDARAQRLIGLESAELTRSSGVPIWTNVFVRAISKVQAPGIGLSATEYEVQPRQFPLTFSERDFLNAYFGNDIVGITVHPLTVTEEQRTARLIVIERSINHGKR